MMGFAIGGHFPRALGAELGFEGIGGVVNSGVQDSAIAAAGMAAETVLFLQNDDA
jgi:hypothetical protein